MQERIPTAILHPRLVAVAVVLRTCSSDNAFPAANSAGPRPITSAAAASNRAVAPAVMAPSSLLVIAPPPSMSLFQLMMLLCVRSVCHFLCVFRILLDLLSRHFRALRKFLPV